MRATTNNPPPSAERAGTFVKSRESPPVRCGLGHHGSWPSSGSSAKRATPIESVPADASCLPLQSLTTTRAPVTGSPRSSVVTHAIEPSRPRLKCTARFVTSAAAATYIGWSGAGPPSVAGPSSDAPSSGLSISTTCRPAPSSGSPTTSVSRAASGFGSWNVRRPSPASSFAKIERRRLAAATRRSQSRIAFGSSPSRRNAVPCARACSASSAAPAGGATGRVPEPATTGSTLRSVIGSAGSALRSRMPKFVANFASTGCGPVRTATSRRSSCSARPASSRNPDGTRSV